MEFNKSIKLQTKKDMLGFTAWNVPKSGVISGSNTGKYWPEITPYLDIFHAVLYSMMDRSSHWKCFVKKGVCRSFAKFRSTLSEVLLGKGVLKICSKFAGEHPCRSAISIKLQSNFIEIALRHGCSPVNLLLIFRTPFRKNTSGWLLLKIYSKTPVLMALY